MNTRIVVALCIAVAILGLLIYGMRADVAELERYARLAQLVFFTSAVGVGGFGVWKHFDEREDKQRWEKAKLAKQMVDDVNAEPKAIAASYMLGRWVGRRYERLEEGKVVAFSLTSAQLRDVIHPAYAPQSRNEFYVRECFDELLYHLDLCAGAADRGLVEWQELKPMFVTLFAGVENDLLSPLVSYARFSNYLRAASKLGDLVATASASDRRSQSGDWIPVNR